MLLRSSSSPILSSMLLCSKESSHEPQNMLKLPRTLSFYCLSQIDLQNSSSPKKTVHVSSSPILSSMLLCSKESSIEPQNMLKLPRTLSFYCLSQIDHQNSSSPKKTVHVSSSCNNINVFSTNIKERNEVKENGVQTLVMGGGMRSNGGCISGGCKGGGNGREWNFYEGNNYGRDRTDAYYKNMIEANPDDSLLLGNYAKFLEEVCEDYTKAEKYLERAILANPDDGHNLSLYADLIWKTEKNSDRAEGYFDQAIKSAPDDCYVMASYAKFLWDTDEDEDCKNEWNHNQAYPTDLFQETINLPRLTAAS